MSKPDSQSKLVPVVSTLFIGWLLFWLLLVLLLPRSFYTTPFFLAGVTPVIGWFLIRPRRITWFLAILSGTSALDDRPGS
ncbi:MAG: hypothetical protein OQL28_10590 [Sedimenticola sp.]|nr:hypothetical protein [Sedimenticola sp.]